MDRLIEVASSCNRTMLMKDFELFRDFSPFSQDTWPYIKGTAEWTLERMPEKEKLIIKQWLNKAINGDPSLYFYSMDWVALLV